MVTNIPPIDIVRGLGSEDEMFLVKIAWVPYKEGDEKVYLGGELEVEPRPKPPSTLSFFVSTYPSRRSANPYSYCLSILVLSIRPSDPIAIGFTSTI